MPVIEDFVEGDGNLHAGFVSNRGGQFVRLERRDLERPPERPWTWESDHRVGARELALFDESLHGFATDVRHLAIILSKTQWTAMRQTDRPDELNRIVGTFTSQFHGLQPAGSQVDAPHRVAGLWAACGRPTLQPRGAVGRQQIEFEPRRAHALQSQAIGDEQPILGRRR